MKTASMIILLGAVGLMLESCTSAPSAPSASQQTIANAVEDSISIGLVPVLSKNPTYLPIAQGVAGALGSFSGTTLTPDDVNAFVGKTKLAPEDAKIVAALVNAAWATYTRRYQAQAGSSLRPDVRLFLDAVAAGINNAVSAVPRA